MASDTDRFREAARRVDREIRHEMAFECRLDMLEYAIRTEAEAAVKARDEERGRAEDALAYLCDRVNAFLREIGPVDVFQLGRGGSTRDLGHLRDVESSLSTNHHFLVMRAEQRGREAERREVEAEAMKRRGWYAIGSPPWAVLDSMTAWLASRSAPGERTVSGGRLAELEAFRARSIEWCSFGYISSGGRVPSHYADELMAMTRKALRIETECAQFLSSATRSAPAAELKYVETRRPGCSLCDDGYRHLEEHCLAPPAGASEKGGNLAKAGAGLGPVLVKVEGEPDPYDAGPREVEPGDPDWLRAIEPTIWTNPATGERWDERLHPLPPTGSPSPREAEPGDLGLSYVGATVGDFEAYTTENWRVRLYARRSGSASHREAKPGAHYRHTSEGRVPISREEYLAAQDDLFGRLDSSPQEAAGEQRRYHIAGPNQDGSWEVVAGEWDVLGTCVCREGAERICQELNALNAQGGEPGACPSGAPPLKPGQRRAILMSPTWRDGLPPDLEDE